MKMNKPQITKLENTLWASTASVFILSVVLLENLAKKGPVALGLVFGFNYLILFLQL